MLILYSLPNCPNCMHIKSKLIVAGYDFKEEMMDTAENITDLRYMGCFSISAPVLRVDDKFFEYCDCLEDNFFSQLFHMRDNLKEIPEIHETHKSLGET